MASGLMVHYRLQLQPVEFLLRYLKFLLSTQNRIMGSGYSLDSARIRQLLC